jgi:amidase
MATKHWRELISEKKIRQKAAIPHEWILDNIPSEQTLNVIDFPENSGLLSKKEIEITNSQVGPLLERLADESWSAVEVTIAFSKRAVIAHQLVSNSLPSLILNKSIQGQLSHRNFY